MQDPAIRHLIGVLLEDQQKRFSGGIERFLRSLSTDAGRKSWEEWRDEPMTRLVLDALKSLSDTSTGSVSESPVGLALGHGVMRGVGLSVKMIEDPTRVFPSIFDGDLDGRRPHVAPVEQTYDTPPEGEEDLNGTTDLI